MSEIESKADRNDARRLMILRRALGYSPKSFAQKFSISENTVDHRERGRKPLLQDLRRQIWMDFGVDCAPIDADEDPLFVLKALTHNRETPNTFPVNAVMNCRERNDYFQSHFLSKPRKYLTNSVQQIYFLASGVFVTEFVTRNVFELGSPNNLLFVGSFIVSAVLALPTILLIPWGFKLPKAEAGELSN